MRAVVVVVGILVVLGFLLVFGLSAAVLVHLALNQPPAAGISDVEQVDCELVIQNRRKTDGKLKVDVELQLRNNTDQKVEVNVPLQRAFVFESAQREPLRLIPSYKTVEQDFVMQPGEQKGVFLLMLSADRACQSLTVQYVLQLDGKHYPLTAEARPGPLMATP